MPGRQFPQATEQLVEGIAAQVGNEIVLASEVLELSGPIEERMKKDGAPEAEILKMRRDALERLIETKLLSSVVERLELGADRDEVDSAIAAIASDNNLTIEQLLSSITGHGLTIEEYRNKNSGRDRTQQGRERDGPVPGADRCRRSAGALR